MQGGFMSDRADARDGKGLHLRAADPIVSIPGAGTLTQRVPTNCLALYPVECKRKATRARHVE